VFPTGAPRLLDFFFRLQQILHPHITVQSPPPPSYTSFDRKHDAAAVSTLVNDV
jgi:hypothetical protein